VRPARRDYAETVAASGCAQQLGDQRACLVHRLGQAVDEARALIAELLSAS
jgi:hypothetical protein